jgi:Xaa-Pro aminopeptidase
MVLRIEVPYYIWGLGGFSPEDTLLVTEEGIELLTTFEEGLIVKWNAY